MIGIQTDQTKKRILQNQKQKIQEQINYQRTELGLRDLVPCKGQDELQQLQDMKNNSNKIKEQMQRAKQQRIQRQKRKKQYQRQKRMKQAPQIYFRNKKRLQKQAFQKRRIKL